jgi:hypothetical protein
MPQGPPDPPPESVILGAFKGLKNTVSRERLARTNSRKRSTSTSTMLARLAGAAATTASTRQQMAQHPHVFA